MKSGQIIIIKKKPGHKHAPHGGAWKVAYADFVTAMMAFFLVLWIVGQSRAVKASIAGYFRDPGIFDQQKSNGVIAGGDFRLDPEGDSRVKPVAIPSGVSEVRRNLQNVGSQIREMLGKMPEFKTMLQHLNIQMTDEGLRIELIESADSSFFDTGSAALKGESEKMLATIAGELSSVKNPVVLEGHTDSRAYRGATEMYTNWELSADRANAARRVLQRSGVAASQIRGVRGTPIRSSNIRTRRSIPATGVSRSWSRTRPSAARRIRASRSRPIPMTMPARRRRALQPRRSLNGRSSGD